jgi:hypothetical protein
MYDFENSFPSATPEDAATQSAPNSSVKPHLRHSSESEVDTPPKADGTFFETPPKGKLHQELFMEHILIFLC